MTTFHITPVHDLLLRGTPAMPVGLYQLHLTTAAQLTRLHYRDGTLTTVKARLKELVDAGYVRADSMPTRLFRSPYFYGLSDKGLRYLADTGMDVGETRATLSSHYLFVTHTLELNVILIAALRLKYMQPGFYLARFQHEHDLKRAPYRTASLGRSIALVPDGFLDVRRQRPGLPDLAMPLLIEHDRATEEQQHFRRRIRAYKALLTDATYLRQAFGTEHVSVAFTTFFSGRRVSQMRDWTRAELAGQALLMNRFLFVELPQPIEAKQLFFDQRWLTLTSEQPIALLEG